MKFLLLRKLIYFWANTMVSPFFFVPIPKLCFRANQMSLWPSSSYLLLNQAWCTGVQVYRCTGFFYPVPVEWIIPVFLNLPPSLSQCAHFQNSGLIYMNVEFSAFSRGICHTFKVKILKRTKFRKDNFAHKQTTKTQKVHKQKLNNIHIHTKTQQI